MITQKLQRKYIRGVETAIENEANLQTSDELSRTKRVLSKFFTPRNALISGGGLIALLNFAQPAFSQVAVEAEDSIPVPIEQQSNLPAATKDNVEIPNLPHLPPRVKPISSNERPIVRPPSADELNLDRQPLTVNQEGYNNTFNNNRPSTLFNGSTRTGDKSGIKFEVKSNNGRVEAGASLTYIFGEGADRAVEKDRVRSQLESLQVQTNGATAIEGIKGCTEIAKSIPTSERGEFYLNCMKAATEGTVALPIPKK